jgi:TRAP-type C4-dicarboxylate transport system permease small subunit
VKILNRLGQVFDHLLWIFAVVSAVLIIAMTLLTDYEVFMRYIFGSGQGWVTELIDNILLYMTFFGVAWLLKEDGHVSVDLVYSNLSPKKKLIIDLIVTALGSAACLFMTWHSALISADNIQRGIREYKTMAAPRGIILAVIPFGFFTLTIEYIRHFYRHLKKWAM